MVRSLFLNMTPGYVHVTSTVRPASFCSVAHSTGLPCSGGVYFPLGRYRNRTCWPVWMLVGCIWLAA